MEKFMLTIIIVMIGLKDICKCCIDNERNALLQLGSSFNPNYSPDYLSSWGTSDTDCCNWRGVTCNSTTGHITRLDLSGDITKPVLGDYWYLNASLFLPFQQLNQLSLDSNNFAGCIHNEGFEWLSTLPDFEALALSSNNFNNSVLHSLSGLKSLKLLDLSRNQLNGTINITELSNLTSTLQVLDLSENEIKGFGNMKVKFNKLEFLGLNYNGFNSSIIPFLKEQSSLKYLGLGYNNIEGHFSFQELNGLSNLQELDLSGNQIVSVTISPKGGEGFNKLENLDLSYNRFNQTANDFLQNIGKMTSLNTLYLQKSRLTGSIQGLCNLKLLVDLNLSYNDLNGNMPPCLANLTSLQNLDISNNLFQIPISLSPFFNLSELVLLIADNNTMYEDKNVHNVMPKFQLEELSLGGYGEGGEIPKFLYHQHNFKALLIRDIRLRGTFPYWLLQNNSRLDSLDLANTSLSGPLQIPSHPHVSLRKLDVSYNDFSGYIHSQLGVYFPELETLDMSNNEFIGRIPNSLCNITALYFLDISQNSIDGTIPRCIGNMSDLYLLDFSNNNLSGSLPAHFSPSSLALVNLSKNRLEGPLKDAFSSCTGLFQLDLSHNRFSGNIPSWVGELSELSFLVLGYNKFHGKIPSELCKLEQLSFIDLSHNRIFGQMLPCLNFTSYRSRRQSMIQKRYNIHLKTKSLAYTSEEDLGYIEHIEITMKGRTYMYEEVVLNYISGMDVSCNYLGGLIPIEIGDLKNVKALNLSQNYFTGTIPPTFSSLREIESLDLSHNNLQGAIPHELTQLTSLIVFNVSYNNLSGQIPNQVRQFATFDESSYRGNPLLCGWLLPKCCSPARSPPSNVTTSLYNEESSKMFIDMEFFYASFGVTYIMVLFTLVVVLYINLYWRMVWFYYVQMIIDETYYFIIDNLISRF